MLSLLGKKCAACSRKAPYSKLAFFAILVALLSSKQLAKAQSSPSSCPADFGVLSENPEFEDPTKACCYQQRTTDYDSLCANLDFCFGIMLAHEDATHANCCDRFPSCQAYKDLEVTLNRLLVLSWVDIAISMVVLLFVALHCIVIANSGNRLFGQKKLTGKEKSRVKCLTIILIGLEVADCIICIVILAYVGASGALEVTTDLRDAACFKQPGDESNISQVIEELTSYRTIAIAELCFDLMLFIGHGLELSWNKDEPNLALLSIYYLGDILEFMLAVISLVVFLKPTIQSFENLYLTLGDPESLSPCVRTCCVVSALLPNNTDIFNLQPTTPARGSNSPTEAPIPSGPTLPPDVTYQQLGLDVAAEGEEEYFGFSVAVSSDGNRIVAGATGGGPNGYNSGYVRVLDWNMIDQWEPVGTQLNGAASARFGTSVAISGNGDRIAVGAPGSNSANGERTGTVQVYEWTGMEWEQLGSDINGLGEDDKLGSSVDISSGGDRLAVGVDLSASNGGDSGSVRIFQWDGAEWSQLGQTIKGENLGDRFGGQVSLAMNGNRLAVGARQNNNSNGINSGHIRVYDWNGRWAKVGEDIDGRGPSDFFSSSMAMSGNGDRIVTTGNFDEEDQALSHRHVRVLEWTRSGWAQVGSDLDPEDERDGISSVAISSDGNRIAIGAKNNNGNGAGAGHVRIFDWNGVSWEKLGPDIEGDQYDEFGTSVAISASGNRMIVGATEVTCNQFGASYIRMFALGAPLQV